MQEARCRPIVASGACYYKPVGSLPLPLLPKFTSAAASVHVRESSFLGSLYSTACDHSIELLLNISSWQPKPCNCLTYYTMPPSASLPSTSPTRCCWFVTAASGWPHSRCGWCVQTGLWAAPAAHHTCLPDAYNRLRNWQGCKRHR
jgi:hypothetical protein